MKQIVFSGHLQALYPNGIEVEGDTAAECLSALSGFPGFREQDEVQHRVVLPQFGSPDALNSPLTENVILVVPMEHVLAAGGKLGQVLMIAIGAFLIYTGWGAAAGAKILGGTIAASTAVSIGVMLVINGVVGLLMPQPEMGKMGKEERSDYLPAQGNTVKIGTTIPLLCGRRRVWGHIVSFNITAGAKPGSKDPGIRPPGGFESWVGSSYEQNGVYNEQP